MNVSIVIPNLNGKEIMQKNFPKLFSAVANIKNCVSEVIVVDDGSWDESVSFISKNYPQIKLFRHTQNRGFSAAVNLGVKNARGNLVLLMNTDVIPEINFLQPVLHHFKNPKVFAVSLHEIGYGYAKGYFGDGYIQLAQGEETTESHPSFYVSGGSGVFRRDIWKELGGMDEKLLSPFYWEDIDICYRAAKRGYLNLWEPKGVVTHKHESTISKFPKTYVQRVRERNQLLCLWKNIHSSILIRKHLLGIISRAFKHPGYLKVVAMTIPRLGIMFKTRNKEMKECKISDEAIFAQFK